MVAIQDAESVGEDTCDEFCYNEKVVERLRTVLPREEQLDEMTDFFSALGNQTRVLILTCLCEAEELCVCDIANTLDMNLSTVSHQLRRLRSLGLITYRRDGKMAFYRLSDPRVERLLGEELLDQAGGEKNA